MRFAFAMFALLFVVGTALAEPQLARLDLAAEDKRIAGEYIVVFKPLESDEKYKAAVESLASTLSGLLHPENNELVKTWEIGTTFRAAFLRLDEDGLLKARAHPDVEYITENAVVTTQQAPACSRQNDVIWNLGRIDTRDINLADAHYDYGYAGEGADVYVIDTGVLTTHVEFEPSRASWGANFVDNVDSDCNGHGTHVAGTIAGLQWGVAKKTTVIAVKVLSCSGSGSWQSVISGVEWTAKSASSRGRPSVANMSLGGGSNAAVNAAVAAAVQSGVTMVVAAGNSNADACTFSPASEPLAVTVAATTIVEEPDGEEKDRRASFSNFGSCVDIAAPGQLIKAAWIDVAGSPPNVSYNTISGTSMASPHVAGVAAILLTANPSLTPAEVDAALREAATNGAIDMGCPTGSAACSKTPNAMLYTACDQ